MVHLDINLLNVVILLFIYEMAFRLEGYFNEMPFRSVRDFVLTNSLILSRLTLIPQVETRYPKTLPELMPNTHFLGFNLIF